MSCTNQAANVAIEPVRVSFGRYQCQSVTTVADVAGSLNETYFVLYDALDDTLYHVWYNVAAGGTDPAPANSTPIEVDIASGATAAAVASATAAAIDAITGFESSSVAAVVCICNTQPGLSTTVADGGDPTGFTFALTLAGTLDDVGLCQGDIELKIDESLLDIKSHQTGDDILTSLIKGKTAELTLTLEEVDITNLKLIFSQAGELYTPSGGTEVVGWGTSTNSDNVIDKAGKLILHPVRLDDTDLSRDWAFWKAHLKPDTVTFSGENPMVVKCTFKAYTDRTKVPEVDLWLIGDHTQDFDND